MTTIRTRRVIASSVAVLAAAASLVLVPATAQAAGIQPLVTQGIQPLDTDGIQPLDTDGIQPLSTAAAA